MSCTIHYSRSTLPDKAFGFCCLALLACRLIRQVFSPGQFQGRYLFAELPTFALRRPCEQQNVQMLSQDLLNLAFLAITSCFLLRSFRHNCTTYCEIYFGFFVRDFLSTLFLYLFPLLSFPSSLFSSFCPVFFLFGLWVIFGDILCNFFQEGQSRSAMLEILRAKDADKLVENSF